MRVLSGLKAFDISEIKKHGVKTLELFSFHNVYSILRVKKGDLVFLTDKLHEDLKEGTPGVVGRVKGVRLFMVKLRGVDFDEVELTAVRVQVEYVKEGRITGLEKKGFDVDVKVDGGEEHVIIG